MSLGQAEEIKHLRERISQLEGDNAMFQKQRDENLANGIEALNQFNLLYENLELPKFVTEEEYLRVKAQLDLVIASYEEKLYEFQATKNFGLLKSHAEAMAGFRWVTNSTLNYHQAVDAYRKDFPK